MSYLFFGVAVLIAIIDWVAVARGWKQVEYVAKPGTMVALLLFVGVNGGFGPLDDPGTTMLWFALGLLFCMFGDIFLMLPRDMFIAGLVSFLIGHIFYVIGFGILPPLRQPHIYIAGIIVLLVLLTGIQVYRRVAAGLDQSGKSRLKLPVLIYALVISAMLSTALFTLLRGAWSASSSLAVSAGAASFFLSDSILALDKFVAPISNARVKTMVTYHLGQFLITLGAALHFLS